MDLIKIAEEAFATAKEFPTFGPGDTISVAYRIKEGNKERVQVYKGVFSLWILLLSTALKSTSSVKFAVLNCITCVTLPVRKLASKSAA